MSRILAPACLVLLITPIGIAQDAPGEAASTSGASQGADESAGGQSAKAAPSAEAKAARSAFDAVLKKYQTLEQSIAAIVEQRKTKAGSEREKLDSQLLELRTTAAEQIGQLAVAGAAVYEADPAAYPQVNETVIEIAKFFLTGDLQGDGGDQYERALHVIEEMLAAGAGDQWNDLYLWGATAAYCTNDFDKAEEYFTAAKGAGLLGSDPPVRNTRDPRYRIWEQAQNYHGTLDQLRAAWDVERGIRAAESEADNLPRVKLSTTRGDVIIELFENEAPEATANFVTLVKKGFYDGVPFHRVLPGFMAQGGDPTGRGSGGPGYNIRCECYRPDLRKHFRGSLSMAHAGRDTGGSQFFLTFVPTSFLDGRHTVFGRVIEGMENAAAIQRRDPEAPSAPKPDKIIKAEVIRDRGHEYKFDELPER